LDCHDVWKEPNISSSGRKPIKKGKEESSKLGLVFSPEDEGGMSL
jgi:hypothetical protein